MVKTFFLMLTVFRMPPMVDDFLYICDGAYTKQELIRMEMHLLKVSNFDLGIPISYRFLRRYARVSFEKRKPCKRFKKLFSLEHLLFVLNLNELISFTVCQSYDARIDFSQVHFRIISYGL